MSQTEIQAHAEHETAGGKFSGTNAFTFPFRRPEYRVWVRHDEISFGSSLGTIDLSAIRRRWNIIGAQGLEDKSPAA
jgi:hypothetical protein